MRHFTRFILVSCLLILSSQLSWAEFRNFSILVDNSENSLLTAAEKATQWTQYEFGVAVADDGTVTRVEKDAANSVATVSGKSHSEHGSANLMVVVPVEGKVKISVATCTYSTGDITVTDANGKAVASATPEATCWKNDHSKFTVLNYKGGATTLTISGMSYCAMVSVEKVEAATVAEKSVYKTNFQNWETMKSSTTEAQVTKATTDGQNLVFSLMETEVKPDGTHVKFTAECITPGYLMAAKTATPYIKTSVLKSVTKVKFVHAATGSKRGWGLKVKGDGDADWVTVSDAVADPASGTPVSVDVNRTNVQLWFYNLTASQNAYMTELEILGNVEVAPRTFKDFTVDFRTDPYTVVAPETGLPEGVSISSGVFHDAQHGYSNVTMTVPVDGPVKFNIGACQYSNKATVSIDGGAAIEIPTNGAGCDSRFGEYAHGVTYTYNVEKAATLTFNLGSYCPFFTAEACDFIPSVTVTYFDTTGKKIGEEVVDGSSELKYKYSVADVTVPEGQAFRGWFAGKSNTSQKVAEGKELTEDLKLYAHATPIEVAAVGTHYDYDLTKNYWYVEDHELISIDGSYYNNHGWTLNSFTVDVTGRCYVNVKNCFFSSEQIATVTDANGNKVAEFQGKAESDGAVASFQYEGEPTKLTVTYPSTAYVHGVEIYNVENFVQKDEATGYYIISSGDASSLMLVLKSAKEGDKIFLPNGTYDFGEVALTSISANNLSLIGESMDGTIIRNAPDKSTEGIGTTATLLNTSKGLYIQDLTIQNALDYYAAGSAGRAVCLQDKGQNTICKNVKMLSYQDTYYSNRDSNFYWEDSEIHGTVDYLCGDGNVVYNRVKLVNESRKKDYRNGECTICAPYNTATTADRYNWGYVFLDCTVETLSETFNFARAWGGEPKATYINTKVLEPSRLIPTRFTIDGMNVAAADFNEYNTTDAEGNVISPASNVLTFTHKTGNKTFETILTADEASEFTVANIFGSWAPDVTCAQQTTTAAISDDKHTLTWEGAGTATAYLVSINGEAPVITQDTSLTINGEIKSAKVRVANARGGFGPAALAGDATSIEAINAETTREGKLYNLAGMQVSDDYKGIVIRNGVKIIKR